jgi:hypothetical protein
MEHERFKDEFRATFALPPSPDRLAALFAIANGLPPQTIIYELAAARQKSPAAMKHVVEALTQRLREKGADTARDVAVRFLADKVLPGMITHEPQLRISDLPTVRRALADPDIVRDAWIPREIQSWLLTFFSVYPTEARAQDSVHARNQALRAVAEKHTISISEAQTEIMRGARQLLDAKRDAFASRHA